MVVAAFASRAASALPLIGVVGAVLFAASDLFVARERFVKSTAINTSVGLPLYYAAQLLIASSL
jgi:uncharacterized membrane protein YhhN